MALKILANQCCGSVADATNPNAFWVSATLQPCRDPDQPKKILINAARIVEQQHIRKRG
jgi:hypothetical protein